MPPRILSDEEEKMIGHIYNHTRKSAREIASVYGLNHRFVVYLLGERLDISLTKKRRKNIYNLNYRVFDNPTEASCYWLGFIYADGHVTTSGNTLTVALSKNDTHHLEKLQKFICTETPIALNEIVCRLDVTHYHMAKHLKSLGITSGRPDFSKMKSWIPEVFFRHFIRGYFDGDGCARKNKPEIHIVGQYDVLAWICDVFYQELSTIKREPRIQKYSKKCWQTSFGGTKLTPKIRDWLYKDASVWLERKKIILDKW